MKIGIIGSGPIGSALAKVWTAAGHDVSIANSRGPETLREVAEETGATGVTREAAARENEVVVIAIPERRIEDLPKDLFDGVADDVAVIDTNNYSPRERDGRIEPIEEGMLESRWVESQIGRPVVKVYNTIAAARIRSDGRPAGDPDRAALPVAGDHERAKSVVMELVGDSGFDPVDSGTIEESWRQQPKTPAWDVVLGAGDLRRALAEADPARPEEMKGTSESPGTYTDPR